MSARSHQRSLAGVVGSTLLVLAACQNSTAPEEQGDLTASPAPAAAAFFPPVPPIPTPHPWVGKTIFISDVSAARCMGPGQFSAGSSITMGFCYWNPNLDGGQRFVVVRAGSVLNGDMAAVFLKLAANTALCLEIKGGTANGGEVAQLGACNSSTRQMFHLPLPGTTLPTRGGVLTKVSNYTMALDVGSTVGYTVVQRPYGMVSQYLKFRDWPNYMWL